MKLRDLMKTYKNHYIVFENAIEPTENSLRIFIHRCKKLAPESVSIGDVTLDDCSPIVIDENLPILQIDFDSYIGYSILNESYYEGSESDLSEGQAFRIYSQSKYLDYMTDVTFASNDYPGPLKHYGFICADHIIDVVSASEPTVIELKQ